MARNDPSRTRSVVLAVVVVAFVALLIATCTSRSPNVPSEDERRRVAQSAGAPRPREARPVETSPRNQPAETPPPQVNSEETTVRIVVTARPGGEPIAGATVRARLPTGQREATTGADGVAALDLGGHDVDVTVRKVGYVTGHSHASAIAAEVMVGLAAGVPFSGRVVFADTRAPAPDVAVRVWTYGVGAAVEIDTEQRTDADGRFNVPGAPADALLSIYAVKRGFRAANWQGGVSEHMYAELVLGGGGVLEGTVFDENGRPMSGVDVLLLQPDRPIPPFDIGGRRASGAMADLMTFVFPPSPTDELGHYRFVGLPLSTDARQEPRCAVARDADGREARSGPAVFHQLGEHQVRDVRFVAPGALRVVVKGAANQPFVVSVTVQKGEVSKSRELDSGEADFDRLPAGEWSAHVDCRRDPEVSWSLTKDGVEVKGGETSAVTFDLGGTATLSGSVIDDLGGGVPSVRVTFVSDTSELSQSATAKTDEKGRFVFEALVPTAGHVMIDGPAPEPAPGRAALADPSWVDATPGGEPVTIVMKRVTTLAGWVTPVPADRKLEFDVRADDTTTHGSAQVGDDGSFAYAIPASGDRVFVTLAAAGAAPIVVVDGNAPAGATVNLVRVKLDSGVTLNLTLRDADGHALAGAKVECLDFFLHGRSATADAEGRLRIEGVPRHALRLLVNETPTTPMSRPVIADPAAPPAVLTIPAGALVTGHVVDASGKALTDRVVISFRQKVSVPDPDGKTTWAWTETDGAYRVRLEPALYRVLVRDKDQGQLSDSVDLAVADGETRTLELRLR